MLHSYKCGALGMPGYAKDEFLMHFFKRLDQVDNGRCRLKNRNR